MNGDANNVIYLEMNMMTAVEELRRVCVISETIYQKETRMYNIFSLPE